MSIVPNPGPPGIRFNDWMFSEPVTVSRWTQPRYAGLFAVLVNDPDWAPKAFRPLHFGEFGNNSPLAALPIDYSRLMAAAQGRNLYVAVLPMPFSTTAQRRELRNELLGAYNPECQAGETVPANINPVFQQPPETPRRRMGFMPQTESLG
jgi:hypothetical protein